MKGVGEPVGRNLEALGRRRQRRAARRIGDEQAFAQRANDEKFVRQRDARRIEIGGLVALADAENAGRGGGGGFAFRAAGEEDDERGEQNL